ncbi:hypothetical protein A8C32_01675 [Flavivirga aquatica]|uniref:Uncharacterized protein n=1 Tax=Flavivirga aquatica TaxID=1849968 RepID=A0A1E5TA01_9FLAO|nr:hypothetical protein [Flavivirga aquatica]OEK08199.1 hypothetical protein A8C32_01675 [Flavivirga aquatica]
MFELRPGETLIHSERNLPLIGLFGTSANNAYNLYFTQNDSSKNYTLIIYMDIQFIFISSKDEEWSTYEKTTFIDQFKEDMQVVWGGKLIKTLEDVSLVYNEVRFNTGEEGHSVNKHWEIKVRKTEKGKVSISYINPTTGDVQLDSDDFIPIYKGHFPVQRIMVDEFGHILGLNDEYKQGLFVEDYLSIINTGEPLKDRCQSSGWLEESETTTLKEKL